MNRALEIRISHSSTSRDGPHKIVAVKPSTALAHYLTAASEVRATHPKADAGDEATDTGATGVKRAFVASGIEIRL